MEREQVAAVAEAARAFVKVYDEFDGGPNCVGEHLAALIDAIDGLQEPNAQTALPARPNYQWSEKYYLNYGGGCSRVSVDAAGKPMEWPYDFDKMNECSHSGPHPHSGNGYSAGH